MAEHWEQCFNTVMVGDRYGACTLSKGHYQECTEEVPEREIDAGARALCQLGRYSTPYDGLPDGHRANWREQAKVVLIAAKSTRKEGSRNV